MIDFDKQMNDYVTSNNGLYRRYCDDLIIIIPLNKSEIESNEFQKHIQNIYQIKNNVPRLTLNLDKTQQFCYNGDSNQNLINLKEGKNILNYLGFSFDGEYVRIREKSPFKYYSRAYRKVEMVKKSKGQIYEHAVKKTLFKKYTHLGDNKHDKGYGNFITYARRSEQVFNKSKVLNNKIHNQIKRHWGRINKRLQE